MPNVVETCGLYTVVSCVSVLCNCFLYTVPHGINHEDAKNAIILELTTCSFSFDIRVRIIHKFEYQVFESLIELFGGSLTIRFDFETRIFAHP